jgi:hypothetical protein
MGNYSNGCNRSLDGQWKYNKMPRLTLNDPNGDNRVSDRFVEDGSYLRIKNVRLTYTIPTKWASRMKLKKDNYTSVHKI